MSLEDMRLFDIAEFVSVIGVFALIFTIGLLVGLAIA